MDYLIWFFHDPTSRFFVAAVVAVILMWVSFRSIRTITDDIADSEFHRHSIMAYVGAIFVAIFGFAMLVVAFICSTVTAGLFIYEVLHH